MFKSSKSKVGFILGAIVLAAYFGWGLWTKESAEILGLRAEQENAQSAPVYTSSEEYRCASNKNIGVKYGDGIAAVTLSDSREFTLERTESASSVRYANDAGQIVFWKNGNMAMVEEDGKATHYNCSEKKS